MSGLRYLTASSMAMRGHAVLTKRVNRVEIDEFRSDMLEGQQVAFLAVLGEHSLHAKRKRTPHLARLLTDENAEGVRILYAHDEAKTLA